MLMAVGALSNVTVNVAGSAGSVMVRVTAVGGDR
jgi:hypothetical protein